MDYFELINNRHSVRSYLDQPVDEGKLQLVLAAINRAPSAGNLQSFEVYVVRSLQQRQALVKAAWDQEFLAQAPVVLVFCAHADRAVERYAERGTELYCLQDATIACTFAMLAIHDLGLSTVWVGAFQEDQVSEIIHCHRRHRPLAMLPVGYASGEPRLRPRRELSDLVHEA